MRKVSKTAFLAGLGIGYVLGARAGRERYEQLQRATRTIRENPTVQETAGVVQAQATGLMNTAKDKMAATLQGTAMGERIAHSPIGERLGLIDLTESKADAMSSPMGSAGTGQSNL